MILKSAYLLLTVSKAASRTFSSAGESSQFMDHSFLLCQKRTLLLCANISHTGYVRLNDFGVVGDYVSMESDSHSVPKIWRLHKDLWTKSRLSLEYQMEQARLKLLENEKGKIPDQPVELVIGQLAASVDSE